MQKPGNWANSPDRPVAGYYQRKLVRGGTWVPVKLWQEGEEWKALIDGKSFDGDIYDLWVWASAHPISESEYRFLLARSSHAKRWLPDHPFAQPQRPVDWLKTPLPKGPKR